ncbi:MAG TPA: SAM-dependent methyltransferase [Aggregatilineaceae bacterium]|nr:SAM-dependent methyltransferase [Aggregatilineaceae bacterium]
MVQVPDPKAAFLETQPSASALNVARCRAIAANEPREEIRGPDYLAEIFLGDDARKSLKDPATHALILKKLAAVSPGGYEYFIARTAYMDAVVERALRENTPQIVFWGAGYDTRSYRFAHLIRESRIFELDSRATQQHKRSLLEQARITIPGRLTFLAIDFTRDNLADVLFKAGYARDRQALFIWEGVTYYLPPQTVDAMLNFVRLNSSAGSIICFDYMLAVSDMADRFGAKQAREAMQAMYTAEPLQFDLKEEQVASFLAERGFQIVDHLATADMQERYLTLHDGSLAGRVLDLFGLVQASVLG